MLTRKSIMSKTRLVASFTLVSRLLGVIREVLQVRFLGASALSDAFFTAYKMPNSLRKIFAEGALSAAFVPTIVQTVRNEGKNGIASLMSLGFIFFESMVLLLCAIAMIWAHSLIMVIAPGFSPEQAEWAESFLYILMPFIFFISSSALLAGPLQAVGHFFVPAFGPVLLNIVYIAGLIVCLFFNLPIAFLCWTILLGGCIQLVVHFITYFKLGFSFSAIHREDIKPFVAILPKFFWCLLSMSVMEIGLFLDTSFGSLLSKGSISLIYYANRFMGIPLGVFAVAFSTILLPHFSRVSAYAPRRLGFYVLEATKLVWWITLPVALIMMALSHKLFVTIFLSEKFTMAQADEASIILIAFLCGLFFFAINKILSNVYYALHETKIPGFVAIVSMIINAALNWILMQSMAATGLALATTIAGIVQTVCLFWLLSYYFKFPLYLDNLFAFIGRYFIQVGIIALPFIGLYQLGLYSMLFLPSYLSIFFLNKIGFWLWVGPLCGLYMLVLFTTRSYFKVRLLFLEG